MNGTNSEETNELCSDLVLFPEIESKFNKYCLGNSSCYIKLRETSDEVNERGLLEKVLDPKIFRNGTDHPECLDVRSNIFLQYSCEETSEESNKKYDRILLVACISSFIALIYSLTIYYLRVKAFVDIKIFDLSTVTAGDYTVFLELD